MDFFPSPNEFDPRFKLFLDRASEKICNWFSKANQYGPFRTVNELYDVAPKEQGLNQNELLNDIQFIIDSAYQPSHPGSLAHLDPPPLTSSIIGDLVCASLNNNLLAYELSPSLSLLENKLCNWLAHRIGMSEGSGGVLASGGSISNLMALVLARNFSNLDLDKNAVILTSQDAHVSIFRGIRVMGLGPDSIVQIPTDSEGRMSLDLLSEAYLRVRNDGKKCFAVVATAGTTVRGAIDPLEEIVRFCKLHNIWLHIDGAIGGVFALSSHTKSIVKGISSADSVTLNPQKILGITKTSSVLLVARISNLLDCFSSSFPYLENRDDIDANRCEFGIQGSRPGEILKLWLGLRQLGEIGINKLLIESINRREYFEGLINQELFKVLSGPLHLIAMTPNNYDHELSLDWSSSTKRLLIDKYNFMLSRPIYNDRFYLKAVLGNPHTKEAHLKNLSMILNNSIK